MLAGQGNVDGDLCLGLVTSSSSYNCEGEGHLDTLTLDASVPLPSAGDSSRSLEAIWWLSMKEPLRQENVLFKAQERAVAI